MGVLGIDSAKQLFHVVGMDDTGTIVWRKRLTRGALLPFIAQLPPLVIRMEACEGAPITGRGASANRGLP
jgi:transposase